MVMMAVYVNLTLYPMPYLNDLRGINLSIACVKKDFDHTSCAALLPEW
jgi:hypothetical protein